MTGQNIIDEARTTLLDSTAPYRWSDALLLGYLNDGLQAVFGRRPDSVIMDDDLVIRCDRPAPLGELDDPVPMGERWRPALVHYVLWRTFDTETDQHQQGARAITIAYKLRFDEDVKVA